MIRPLRREADAKRQISLDRKKAALVLYPWVLSGCCAAGERRAESAEVEHGESDECFG